MTSTSHDLSLDDLIVLDGLAVQFEKALSKADPTNIESVLASAPDHIKTALFSELIALELSYRRRTHHATPLQQSYYTRFPQYKDIIDEAYSEQGIPQPDKTERVIDGYLLQRQLGRGGMGVVYQALDLHLNRTVALKMLSADCISGEQLSRFQTESRVLAKLDHHNVLKIHAVGYWHDQPYLVLEYADGGSLADRLAQGPLGLQDTLQLMTALVDAVTFLHEQTLIHRDLKPSNILFTQDGTVKIADFGLVRDSFSDACHTHADSQLGTPAYMAPEQLNADMGVASPASDIFSLGAIMHHMLTGTVPYAGLAVSDMVSALSSQRPVPVQHLQQGGIPASFARICRRCLKKEPAQRYPSAAALSADLQRLQQGLRISPLPLFWQSVLGQSRKLAATVAVFVLGAVLMASFQYSATDTEPGFMSSERLGRLPPETLALLREGTAVENASVDNTSTENSPLAMTLLDGNTLPGVSLKAPLGLALHDERYLAIADTLNNRILLLDLQSGELSRLAGNGDASYAGDGGPAINSTLNTPGALTFDPDGNLYVADRRNHTIRVIDPTGTIQTLTGFNGCLAPTTLSSRPYLCHPTDIATPDNMATPGGQGYYVADGFHQRIRHQQNNVVMTTILDASEAGYDAVEARPFAPFPRAIEYSDGRLYFLDASAGTLNALDEQDGIEQIASGFFHPTALAIDHNGYLYVSDASNVPITRVNPANGHTTMLTATALFGDPDQAYSVDSLAIDSTGNLFFTSLTDNSLRMVPSAQLTRWLSETTADDLSPRLARHTDRVSDSLSEITAFSYVGFPYQLLMTDITARLGFDLIMENGFDSDSRINLTNYPLTGRDMLAVSCFFIGAQCGIEGNRLIVASPEQYDNFTGVPPLSLPDIVTRIENASALPETWREALRRTYDMSRSDSRTFGEFLAFIEQESVIEFELNASAEEFRNASYHLEHEYRLSDLLVTMILARDISFHFVANPDRLQIGYQPNNND